MEEREREIVKLEQQRRVKQSLTVTLIRTNRSDWKLARVEAE